MHEVWCFDLLISRALHCSLPAEALMLQELSRSSPLTAYRLPAAIDRTGEPLPASWEAYFEDRWPELSLFERMVLTESLSGPMTILWVLDALGLRTPLPGGVLRVVLVGADCEADQPWAELLPFVPFDVELTLVGPLLTDAEWQVQLPGLLRRGSVSARRGLLQDLDRVAGPVDLCVALNSGMVFYPTWSPALKVMRGFGCPVAVTAWRSSEAFAVRSLLVDAVFECCRATCCPFASRCPKRVVDDHGTAAFGNLCTLLFSPRKEQLWQPLLRPPTGQPDGEDVHDALRLIQGFLAVECGVHAELEAVLDSPDDYCCLVRDATSGGEHLPEGVARDLVEAYEWLGWQVASAGALLRGGQLQGPA